jgi:hypothetical protein
MCVVLCPAVEVILAAPGKVPKEEKLYVQKATFGKVRNRSRKTAQDCCACLHAVDQHCWHSP